ncbi:MAG: hypothetical protein GY757_32695 [bacterium]|nr:hypothetical protein [bacterium]
MERVVKTIRFPVDVLQEMQQLIKEKKTNFTSFVIEAIQNHIRAEKYRKGIDAGFGAWEESDHPELANGTDNYIRDIRKSRTL